MLLTLNCLPLFSRSTWGLTLYTLIADESLTFWLQLVGSLPCACAYFALFARITITQPHTRAMQQTHTHTHKTVTGRLKPKSYSLVQGNRSIVTVRTDF